MSVAAGMAVIVPMFEAEVSAVAGPKGRGIPERVAVRHGTGKGSVTLGGGRVEVSRPRAERTTTTSRPRDSNDQDTRSSAKSPEIPALDGNRIGSQTGIARPGSQSAGPHAKEPR